MINTYLHYNFDTILDTIKFNNGNSMCMENLESITDKAPDSLLAIINGYTYYALEQTIDTNTITNKVSSYTFNGDKIYFKVIPNVDIDSFNYVLKPNITKYIFDYFNKQYLNNIDFKDNFESVFKQNNLITV